MEVREKLGKRKGGSLNIGDRKRSKEHVQSSKSDLPQRNVGHEGIQKGSTSVGNYIEKDKDNGAPDAKKGLANSNGNGATRI